MTLPCPRRLEGTPVFAPPADADCWRSDGACSYCGSLRPEAFFAAIASNCQIIPTDKSYKVYVELPHPLAGQPAIYSMASGPVPGYEMLTPERADEIAWERPQDRFLYIGRHVAIGSHPPGKRVKFYFQHLDENQRMTFVELMNMGVVNLGAPGAFYVLPFFMRRYEDD